jgi:hypothetical protein
VCPECRILIEKVWWILKFTEPRKEEQKPKIFLPGDTGEEGISMVDAMKKVARGQP